MSDIYERTAMLLGKEAVENLWNKRILVFGVGGVGGYATEALARSGIGTLDLVDNDTVSVSNINRQIIATHDTVGMLKTDAMKARIHSINPNITVNRYPMFVLPETLEQFDLSAYDYVLDAIDTVSTKIALAVLCEKKKVPLISAMGAGNKLDPTRFEVTDIYKTSVCPLAKVMRTELRKRGVRHLKVVYSKEEPIKPVFQEQNAENDDTPKRRSPGSIAFVPSVAGLVMAGEVIRELVEKGEKA